MAAAAAAGLGPWHVGLFFNLNADTVKKQTELCVHGSVLWYAAVRNRADLNDCLVPIMAIGPFLEWNDALGFFNLWSSPQARGKSKRINRGLSLLKAYHQRYHLKLWVQCQDDNQIRQQATVANRYEYTASSKRGRLKQLLNRRNANNSGIISLQSIIELKRKRAL